VVGSAFFCPNCGCDNIETSGLQLISKIELVLNNLPALQATMATTLSKDDAIHFSQSLLESSLTQCLSIFQHFSDSIYNKRSSIPAPFNAFQRVHQGNELWISLLGRGYENWLSPTEYQRFETMMQRRHLLEHKGAIVDQKYLDNTSDGSYRVGERLVVRPDDVLVLSAIIKKLMDGIVLG